ncbi:hypothetical protein ACQB60_19780 [Actinomycetota bacterium Odt1-20B]
MKRSKSAIAVGFTAAALLSGTWGSGVADADPAPAPATGRAPHSAPAAAANVCTQGAAPSGRKVPGQLTKAQVDKALGGQTKTHREARGWKKGGHAQHPLKQRKSRKGVGPAEDIHPAQGTAFLQRAGNDGGCATQSVSTRVNVTEGSTTIYTPTLYPAGGSCIELVTVYVRGRASVSAWDWCEAINFQASVPIDEGFLKRYTDGSTSPAYSGRVVRTDASTGTWTAELYNHETGRWDELYTKGGVTQGRMDGWDIYELYSSTNSQGRAYSCAAMAGQVFESRDISVRNGGTWAAAAPANSNTGYDQPDAAFKCPERTYQMLNQYDHWKAVG